MAYLVATGSFGREKLGGRLALLKDLTRFKLGLSAMAIFAFVAWELPTVPALLTVGGFQIKPEDVVVLWFFWGVVSRPDEILSITRRYNLLLVLIGLCVISSLLFGLISYGSAAINEARGFVWGIVATAWLMNQDWGDPDYARVFRRWARILAIGLIALFVYHSVRYGLGAADSFVTISQGVEQTGRPLVSGQAILLACLGVVSAAGGVGKERVQGLLLGGIAVFVAILCQHRSVWAAVGLASILVFSRLRGAALARTLLCAYFLGSLAFVLVASGVLDSLLAEFQYSVSSAGTYEARVDTWGTLVAESIERGPWSVVFGEPFGFGYERVSGGQLVTFAPHNWYVSIFLRLGLVGLFCFLALLAIAGRSLSRRRGGLAPAMVLVALIVYCWSYSMPWYISPALAWVLVFPSFERGAAVLAKPSAYAATMTSKLAEGSGHKFPQPSIAA